MKQRTYGGIERLAPTLYNSGRSGDYRAIVHELAQNHKLRRMGLIGHMNGRESGTQSGG